ncbi:MAG TPA: serine hydrolase domain-containing protein [Bacteroidia bacterium]|nr:serine hydrolase domain-containing protein [Bacteroidia bacterium]
MKRFFLLPLFALLFFSCANRKVENVQPPAVDSTPIIYRQINADLKKQQLDTFFSNRFVDGRFSGCVLIAQRGIILFEKAFGWANHEKRDSLHLDNSFQLASVSKQFTASAVMLLHQEGKLQYDDTLGKYFPHTPWHGLTIRELLTHRCGLDHYTNVVDNYFISHDTTPSVFSNDSAISMMEDLSPHFVRAPGTKFNYSNTGYMLLAGVVEKISGQPFWEFMQQNFFAPLGMQHTWIATDGQEHPGKTRGYFSKWIWWQDNYLDNVTGDKGVYSSVEDMYKWDRSLKNNTILKKEVLDEAYKGYSPELEARKPWNYGFGWRILKFDDGAMAVFHNGWWHGYTSAFYRGLSDDVTVVILCNKYNRGIYDVRPILQILGAHHQPVDVEENEGDSAADSPHKSVPAKKSAPEKKRSRKK